MDTKWFNLLSSLGHTPTIYSQTTLDDTLFFGNTDILIVSSGVIPLGPNIESIIEQFLLNGGKIYFQTEYDPALSTNQVFQSVVTSLGATFSWNGITAGTLNPMNVLNNLQTPNTVLPIDAFWYGTPGSGCNGIEPFLEYNNAYYGFIFCTPGSGGRMITTCDQDWIRGNTPNDILVMENIIYNLTLPFYSCPSNTAPVITIANDSLISSSAATYQWYNNSGAISGATSQVYMPTQPGFYHVCVTYESGCSSCSDSVFIKVITDIMDAIPGKSFTVFPNPSRGNIQITLNSMHNQKIIIYNSIGEEVYKIARGFAGMHQISITLVPGIYVAVLTSSEKSHCEKLIVE
jgi:hypothetical protein